MIGGFYIGKHYRSLTIILQLYALGNLSVFNLADFCNSPNHQNKFYTKFSSCMVHTYICSYNRHISIVCTSLVVSSMVAIPVEAASEVAPL